MLFDNGEIETNPNTTQTHTLNNSFNNFQLECKQLFGKDLFTIIEQVNTFLPTFLNITNTQQKKNSLIFFLLELGCTTFTP